MRTIKNFYQWTRTVVPDKYRNKWFIFAIILCCVGLDNFNVTATVITTDSVQKNFNTTYATASWVVSAYALTLGSFIILFGKLADILGPDNIFILGINIFWICSLICATVDESVIAVIIFRAFQGIGGAALVPSSYALAANYFYLNPKQLQLSLGLLFIFLTGSLGSGAVVGGAFAETTIGYKGLFYFVFAASLLLGIASLFLIIPVDKTEGHKQLKIRNIDFIGMTIFVIGALLVILGLTEGGDNWKTPKAYVPLPVGVCLILIVLLWELVYIGGYKKKARGGDTNSENMSETSSSVDVVQIVSVGFEKEKNENTTVKKDWRANMDLMFPLETLSVHDFTFFAIGSTLYYTLFAFVISLSIEYNVYVSRDSPIITACKILPYVVALLFNGIFVNEELIGKLGNRLLLLISSTLTLVGYIVLTRETYAIHNGFWKFGLPGLFIFGIGNSLFYKYFFIHILPYIPMHLQGNASGIYQSFSQIGYSVGNALLASLVGKITVASNEALQHEYNTRFENARYIGFGLAGVIFILTCFMGWGSPESCKGIEEIDESVTTVDTV